MPGRSTPACATSSPAGKRRAVAADASADTHGVIDEIAGRTLLAGGRVLALRRDEIPGGGPLAAILRYPL